MSIVKILSYLWSSVFFFFWFRRLHTNYLARILGGLGKCLEQQLRIMTFCRALGYPGIKYRYYFVL